MGRDVHVATLRKRKINVAQTERPCVNDCVGLQDRPYESSFSKAVRSSGVIQRLPFSVSLLLKAQVSTNLSDQLRRVVWLSNNEGNLYV
ncbi:TPA: hypothetical protein MH733_19245 [Klebsiella pneumoniae]|nr:hypothetical protein [Klebsiella pneumoniae]HBX6637017.1 hypothetical protein [Klebsiella pneumoniae]HBX6642483.1 hypothetical protein [Klebsiella pneumoniae]HBX6648220.1 hypothetical protein [Klebsiella pneumoniae]HBX6681161.1 hypothetical protein [Klebsiella pneumoniae]